MSPHHHRMIFFYYENVFLQEKKNYTGQQIFNHDRKKNIEISLHVDHRCF